MRIAYVGRVSLQLLARHFRFDRELPKVAWAFHFGTEVVCELVRRGHQVVVVTEDANANRCGRYTSNQGIEVRIVPSLRLSSLSYLTFFMVEASRFVSQIQDVKPDVVFAQWTYVNALAGAKSGYPMVAVAHDAPWRVAGAMRSWKMLLKAFYSHFYVLPRIKNLIAVSPYIAQSLRRFHGYRGRLSVIPNGLPDDSHQMRGCKVIRETARTIVCVSQWMRLKNATALLKAFAELKARYPDWKLIMYGEGFSDSCAGRWMKRNNIPSRGIDLRGYCSGEEIRSVLYDEADVFCSPSLEESFGMVFVEAMAQGVPCVGGESSGGVPWVIGKAGRVCDVSDYSKLANCIESLMLDYHARCDCSKYAVKRVKSDFNMSSIVSCYESALENALKSWSE